MKKSSPKLLVLLLAILLIACLSACSVKAYADGPSNDSGDIVTYKATFVTNYGTAPVDSRGTPMETSLRIIPESPITTRAGYVFVGWYLTSDWTDTVVQFPYIMTGNTTFYAKWQSAGLKPVSTVEDLRKIGEDTASLAGSYYLTNDIDLAGIDWIPIGLNYDILYDEAGEIEYIQLTGENAPQAFTGTLDGNGYFIKNMTIKPFVTEKEANYLPYGLFARLGRATETASYPCTVKNVRMSGFNIELAGHLSRFYLGALAGKMEAGTVTNCHVSGNVVNAKIVYESSIWDDFFGSYAEPTERTDLGGLIGRLKGGTVIGCSAQGKVTSESVAESVNAGGLIGCNEQGTISNCYAQSTVYARYAGGLVGMNCSTIEDSFSSSNVNCSLSYPCVAGGLVGYNMDYEVTSTTDSTITTFTKAIIKRSYSSGDVSGRIAGGLVGINIFSYMRATGGIINDCYSLSDVFSSEYGGGLIGRAEADVSVVGSANTSSLITDNFFFITNCIAYGDVVVSAENVTYYYIDDFGKEQEQSQKGVYYSVFAGGFIGHAYEPRISGCLSFGNVTASSTRPAGDLSVSNSTFADNFIGHSTNTIAINRNSFVGEGVTVTRNGDNYTSEYSSAPQKGYKLTTGDSLSSSSFLMSIGFSAGVWNLENINISEGRYPALR